MTTDFLYLDWSTGPTRDRAVGNLICAALREWGYVVRDGSIFDYRYLILSTKPKVVIVPSPVGAKRNYEAVMYAKAVGAKVYTFLGEGNTRENIAKEVLWGNNTSHSQIEDICGHWSSRARNLWIDQDASLTTGSVVTGAVGFDRYKIFNHADKSEFLRRYGFDYDRIIGFAGFVFERFFDPHLRDKYVGVFGEPTYEMIRQDLAKLRNELRIIVESHPDCLFLLKPHPHAANDEYSEFRGLEDLPNVLFVPKVEPIEACIAASDLWFAYESTTCLEAWLLGKETALINPSGADFKRQPLYRGSVPFTSAKDAGSAIDSWIAGEGLPGFAERAEMREQLIRGIIQWADGKNFMRAAWVLSCMSKPCSYTFSMSQLLAAWLHHMAFECSRFKLLHWVPVIKFYATYRRRFKATELEEWNRKFGPQVTSFMLENPLSEDDKESLRQIAPEVFSGLLKC